MINTQTKICSFCALPLSTPDHPCPHILYTLTNSVAEAKQDSPSLLGDINNLVFQGGGIKGIAYLGALQQLQKEKPDFLSDIHRIAGTSAGSMVALYLGLNLDVDTDIKKLLQRDFVKLLDDTLVLKVIVELNLVFSYKYKNFTAKDIFLTALIYFGDLAKRLGSGNKSVVTAAEKEAGVLAATIIKYLSTKIIGTRNTVLAGCIEGEIAGQATKWLLSMLRPAKPAQPQEDSSKKLLKSSPPSLEGTISDVVSDSVSDVDEGFSRLEEIVERECEKALNEVSHEVDEETKPKLLSAQSPAQEDDEEKVKRSAPSEKTEQAGSRMHADATEYLLRSKQTIKTDPASDLKGRMLYHALAEMVYFLMLSQRNAAGIQQKLGLFDGSIVKAQLIEEPIRQRQIDLHLEPKDNITFKELWDLNSGLREEQKFKKFYVTSFNVETFRTEVFSVDHSPNVVIADAVRASMSIPVFFTPVTIREKTAQGLTDKKIYSSNTVDTTIHYMDGGILDNYPIWIFDDFKYCVQDIPGFKPRMRYSMQNPRTLGFRLMSTRIIDIYTNPYFDPEQKKMKQINESRFAETFTYQIGMLLNAEINQTQENEHIKRGDCARTAYVDNLGMSAIQFILTQADIDNLVKSGAQSVSNYKARAALNGFVGEGEAYL